jgi:hypothetical protein
MGSVDAADILIILRQHILQCDQRGVQGKKLEALFSDFLQNFHGFTNCIFLFPMESDQNAALMSTYPLLVEFFHPLLFFRKVPDGVVGFYGSLNSGRNLKKDVGHFCGI